MPVLEEVARLVIKNCICKVAEELEGILSRCCLTCGEGGRVSWYLHALEHEVLREGSRFSLLSRVSYGGGIVVIKFVLRDLWKSLW